MVRALALQIPPRGAFAPTILAIADMKRAEALAYMNRESPVEGFPLNLKSKNIRLIFEICLLGSAASFFFFFFPVVRATLPAITGRSLLVPHCPHR